MKKLFLTFTLLVAMAVASFAQTAIDLSKSNKTITTAGDYSLTSNNVLVDKNLIINVASADTVRIAIQNLKLQATGNAIEVKATNTAPVVFNVIGNNIIKGGGGAAQNYAFNLEGNTHYFFRGTGVIDFHPEGTNSSDGIRIYPTTGNDNTTVVNFDGGITIKGDRKVVYAGNTNHKKCVVNVNNANLHSKSDQVFNLKNTTLNIFGGNLSTEQSSENSGSGTPVGVIFLDNEATLNMAGGTITSKNVGLNMISNSSAQIAGGSMECVSSAISYGSSGDFKILDGTFTTTGEKVPCVKINGRFALIGGGTIIGKNSNALQVNSTPDVFYPEPRVNICWNNSNQNNIPAPLLLGEGASPAVDLNGNSYIVQMEGGTIKQTNSANTAAGVRINSTSSDDIVFAMKSSAEIISKAETMRISSKAKIKIGDYTIYRAPESTNNVYKIFGKKQSGGALSLRATDINSLDKISAADPMLLTFLPKKDGVPNRVFVPTGDNNVREYSFISGDFETYQTFEIRKAQQRNITYDASNASGFNKGDNPATYWEHNGTNSLKAASADCQKFLNWQDASGAEVTHISTDQMGDVTLYANWEPLSISSEGAISGGEFGNFTATTPGDTVCSGGVPTREITEIKAPTYDAGQTLSYQWQIGTILPGSIYPNWEHIEGATLATYTPTQAISETTYFRRLVTSNCTTAYLISQNVWEVVVRSNSSVSAGRVRGGSDTPICGIENVEPLQVIDYEGGTPHWLWSNDPQATSWTPLDVFGETLTVAQMNLQPGENYFCVSVSTDCGNVVSRNSAPVILHQQPIAPTSISGTASVGRGGSTVLTAEGGYIGYPEADYEWAYKRGADYVTIPNDSTETITLDNINETTVIAVRFTENDCGGTEWTELEINVTEGSYAGVVSGGGRSCDFADIVPITLSQEGTNGNVVCWQRSKEKYSWDEDIIVNQIDWQDIPETANLFELTTDKMGFNEGEYGIYFFRAVVQNGTQPVAYSNAVAVFYQKPAGKVETIQGPDTIGFGKTATFIAVGGDEGLPGAYEWGWGSEPGENSIDGATSATIEIGNLESDTTIWVRRTDWCSKVTEATFKHIAVVNTFDLTYDYGDIKPENPADTTDTFVPGDDQPLSDGNTLRPFYEFKGWHLDSPGGDVVDSISDLPEGDHTLYGEWERKIPGVEIVISLTNLLAVRNADNYEILRDPNTVYSWYKDGTLLDYNKRHYIEVETGKPVPAGKYSVVIKIDDEWPIVVDREIKSQAAQVYPNPVEKNGTIFVENLVKNLQKCELIDAFGYVHELTKVMATDSGYQIPINQQSGVYTLRLIDTEGKTVVHRVVVK